MKTALFSSILIIAIIIISCDNTLEPINREKGIFGIYGFLDLNEEIHYIRVRDLNAPFTREATQELDATVTLRNITSGSSEILEMTIMEFEDVFLHNYIVKDEVIPNNEYQLSVERSDGAVVELTTITPRIIKPEAIPVNQDCYTPIDVEFAPLNGGTIALRVGIKLNREFWGSLQVLRPNDYHPNNKAVFTFIPNQQVQVVPFFIDPNRRCNDMNSNNIYIAFTHYSPGFFERIENDPFDIFFSTQRFGAFYEDTLAIPVDTSRVCPPDC